MQEQIAAEDRRRVAEQSGVRGAGALPAGTRAELAGDVRDAAPHGVPVDHVVVHDERGVQELEGRRDGVEPGRGLGLVGEGVERPDHQGGPEPLPAGAGARDRIAEHLDPAAQGHRPQPNTFERGVDGLVDVAS